MKLQLHVYGTTTTKRKISIRLLTVNGNYSFVISVLYFFPLPSFLFLPPTSSYLMPYSISFDVFHFIWIFNRRLCCLLLQNTMKNEKGIGSLNVFLALSTSEKGKECVCIESYLSFFFIFFSSFLVVNNSILFIA